MKDPENLSLLVKILNKYIYFFMSGIEQITAGDINKLIELIRENIKQITEDGKRDRAKSAIKVFENTIAAVNVKKVANPSSFESVILE